MRERNVFGKKINHISFVIILVVLFLAVIGARLGMLAILESRLSDLETEHTLLQKRMDAMIADLESRTYHEVYDIIDELPNAFDQIGVSRDLSIARGLAGIASANYSENILDEMDNPLESDLPNSVKAVQITITMSVDDVSLIPEYLEAILGLERIFYIENIDINYFDSGAFISLTVYTFYNDIDL